MGLGSNMDRFLDAQMNFRPSAPRNGDATLAPSMQPLKSLSLLTADLDGGIDVFSLHRRHLTCSKVS